jgi:hypothetical protein
VISPATMQLATSVRRRPNRSDAEPQMEAPKKKPTKNAEFAASLSHLRSQMRPRSLTMLVSGCVHSHAPRGRRQKTGSGLASAYAAAHAASLGSAQRHRCSSTESLPARAREAGWA